MVLQWKSFKIDLKSFYEFLESNIPNSDGILANDDNMIIVEASPLTEGETQLIQDYYSSLTESGEQFKLARPQLLNSAITVMKESLLTKDLNVMTVIERKVLLGLALTKAEEDTLLGV